MLNDDAAPESGDDIRKQVNVYEVFSTGPRGLEEWRAELRARGREEWCAQTANRPNELPSGPAKCLPGQRSANRPSKVPTGPAFRRTPVRRNAGPVGTLLGRLALRRTG